MEFIHNLHNLRERHRNCAATIGNFDGVHLGHQAIIKQLKTVARSQNLPAVLVTFEPHPQEFFMPGKAPARLMRLREKIACMQEYGIDRMVALRFDQKLAAMPAENFVKEILVQKLDIKRLIVGDDFRFGNNRQGDIAQLREFGKIYGFAVDGTVTCEVDGRRISSSRVRETLGRGDMDEAVRLLGRPYTIAGRVVHGAKRGRSLGYPTININLHRLRSPVSGIFASKVYGLGQKPVQAVTSIGTRPMFDGGNVNLEAHLLDFDREAYGAYVRVELLKQLRLEQMFDTIESLKEQIEKDIAATREFFAGNNKKKAVN